MLEGERRWTLFATLTVLSLVIAITAGAASAESEITWTVTCPAASYCEYHNAHKYDSMRTCPRATFPVSVDDFLVDQSWGKGQSGSGLTPCVGEPIIYNEDPSNSRTFDVYLYYP